MPLDNKSNLFEEFSEEIISTPESQLKGILNPFDGDIDDFKPGEFLNLANIRLRWVDERWFEFLPGSVGQQGKLSRPDVYQWRKYSTLSGGKSAYLLGSMRRPISFMNWEFDLHHCGHTQKAFEETRDTMMEAVADPPFPWV
jgi:hypothetical protein